MYTMPGDIHTFTGHLTPSCIDCGVCWSGWKWQTTKFAFFWHSNYDQMLESFSRNQESTTGPDKNQIVIDCGPGYVIKQGHLLMLFDP